MKESNLIQLLKSLSARELKDFEKFIASPYFNKGRNLMPYFKILIKTLSDKNSSSQEFYFRKLYPAKAYDSKAKAYINKLNSELLKLAEEYLIVLYYSESYTDKRIALHKMLNKKHLSEYNIKEITKTKNQFNISCEDEYYFHYATMLNSLETDLYLNMNNMKKYRELRTEDRLLIRSHFLVLYWFEKMLFVTFKEQFNYETKGLTKFDSKITPEAELEVLEELRKENPRSFKIAEVYYLLKEAFINLGEETKYEKAKDAALKNFDLFAYAAKHNLLVMLEAIIIFSEKKHGAEWKQKKFDIKMIMLEHEVFSFMEGDMYYLNYDNIVKLLLDSGELTKAEDFIKNHTSKLPVMHRENCKNMALAWVHLYKKDFNKALKFNANVKHDVFSQRTYSKLINVLCYYELGEYELTLSSCASFQKYLADNPTMNPEITLEYNNFVTGMKLLVDAIYNKNGDTQLKFKKFLAENEIIYRKKWLLEKISELEK